MVSLFENYEQCMSITDDGQTLFNIKRFVELSDKGSRK